MSGLAQVKDEGTRLNGHSNEFSRAFSIAYDE
jgi:hypothetical protein